MYDYDHCISQLESYSTFTVFYRLLFKTKSRTQLQIVKDSIPFPVLTLQRGVTGTARMLHALTHSSISRQVREQM